MFDQQGVRLLVGFTARYKFISRNSGYRHIPRRAEKHGIAVLPGWLPCSRSQIPWIPRQQHGQQPALCKGRG